MRGLILAAEVVFAVAGVVLSAVAAWGWREAVRSRRTVHQAGVRNGRRLIALADVRRQQARTLIGVSWCAAGLLALFGAARWMAATALLLLIVGPVVLVVDAVRDERVRRRLLR